jgi:VWFA-related protein
MPRRSSFTFHRAALIAGFAILLVAGSIRLGAQNAQKQNAQQPTFRAGANFVRVDVYPTIKGAAVRDLVQDDFEILEDGVLQRIESFEYVNVRGGGIETEQHEPSTVAESRQIAETTKGRLFVIFLDTYFVDYAGSHRLQRTLVNFLHRIVGPDDMYAVMTPEMSALDLSFARRTDTIEGYLSKYWFWGQKDRLYPLDPIEQSYVQCYPDDSFHPQYKNVAKEMILRRHERQVLGALRDLSVYLGGVREERKAVITLTGGWVLFRENPNLTRGGGEGNVPQVGTTPDGRLVSDAHKHTEGYSMHDCEVDRQHLAMLDDWQFFRDMFDVANRTNVTFYPVNALGLVAFDKDLGTNTVPGEIQALGPAAHPGEDPNTVLVNPMVVDRGMISQRRDNLRALAENTDGLAVVETNDIDKGMKRIVDDLTSYYLLGYNSTNGKLDGRFRKITVRVKRPGVDVRARRGYRAATEKEVEEGRIAQVKQLDSAPPTTMQVALNSLGSARPGIPLHTSVSYAMAGGTTADATKAHLWALVELDGAVLRQPDWIGGGTVEATLLGTDGTAVTSQSKDLPAGARAAAVDLGEIDAPDGEISVRTRITPKNGGLPYTDTIRLGKVESPGRPILLRRGPSTGINFVPTANPQFQRTERVRVDLPLHATQPPVAEVLDRTGKTLQVPVKTSIRTENGMEWVSAEVTLAPLAPGDYLIRMKAETNGTSQEVITGFRLVP